MAEVALWQYRWLNPGDDANATPAMLAWKEVEPWNPRMQTLEQRIEELRSFRYNGKPSYEVRALGVIPDGVPPLGWLYDWTHSSALGKPDEHFTGFTTDEAYARKHENVRPVWSHPCGVNGLDGRKQG